MSSLYEQLLALRNIPGAFDRWKEYRRGLTEYIILHTMKGNVLIVGAGSCNDLDLKKLEKHFTSITLMDMDMEAVQRGIKAQGADEQIVKARYCDIVGINKDAYITLDKMAQAMIRVKSFNHDRKCPELEMLFEKKMQSAFRERRSHSVLETFGPKSFDHVICVGVHSQLNNMFCQLAEVYSNYVEFDINKIYRLASYYNNLLAKELDADLAEVSKGHFILGIEKERAEVKGGVEGAFQAGNDIRSKDYVILNGEEMTWPFDKERNYKMDIMSVEKSVK